IILGYFNYSYSLYFSASSYLNDPRAWLDYLYRHFQDCFLATSTPHKATFLRGSTQSCLDYIFVTNDLSSSCLSADVTYIQCIWSDHMLVSSRFSLNSSASTSTTVSHIGKGVTRVHPRLASTIAFCKLLLSRKLSFSDGFEPFINLNCSSSKSSYDL
ncbi:MAG: hypothetical protein EXX96DRAFT_474651, partial [Benjaminiella poitrasii]